MHAFISQTIKKQLLCTSFSPTLWVASLHSTTSVGWSWKEDHSTSPSFNFWNLCCDWYCHRSTVLQHHHSFIHNFVLHMHTSVSTGKPKVFQCIIGCRFFLFLLSVILIYHASPFWPIKFLLKVNQLKGGFPSKFSLAAFKFLTSDTLIVMCLDVSLLKFILFGCLCFLDLVPLPGWNFSQP